MIDRERLAREHLAFLWPSIQSNEDVIAANRLCRELDASQLAHLLRHHDSEAIRDIREVDRRRIFDYALQAYSMLTVALVAGYVPSDLGPEICQALDDFLGREAVRSYYEKHYPVLLPSLLRLHAKGSIHLPQESGDLAWGGFQWFVRFSGRFEKDRNLEAFLDLLDSFHWDEDLLDIDSFLAELKNPQSALGGILKPADLLSRRDRAVLGLIRFMIFCRELAPALEGMADAPLTQSACWFYYAYWFKGFSNVGNHVEECLSIFEQWIRSSESIADKAALEGKKTVSDVRIAIGALVDGRYAAPLVNRLK